MSDLNYNIEVGVEGGDEVQTLRDNISDLNTDVDDLGDAEATVTVESEGVTETAEGLATIADTDAAGSLVAAGDAAGDAAPKAGEAATAFGQMLGALSLVEVASFGIDQIMGRIRDSAAEAAAQNAFDATQVEAFAAALADAANDANTLFGYLSNAGEIITSIGGEERDLVPALAEAGITAAEFTGYVEGGAEGLQALEDRLWETSGGLENYQDIVWGATQIQNNLTDATDQGAARNEVYAETQATANAALQEFLDNEDPMRRFGAEWALLTESISDGSLDTTAASNALNTLATGLGLTTEEVLALAQAQVAEGAAGAQAYAEALASVDFRTSDLQGATSAFAAFTTEAFAAGNATQAIEEAYAGLALAVGDGAINLDTATEAGRAQQDALQGLAGVLDTQLAQAYANADGNQQTFLDTAGAIGVNTLARLQEELGLTADETTILAQALGLTQGDYEARFALAGAAEAQVQLGLLQGAIEGLPPDVELRVNTLIVQGEYVAARDEVATYYANNPPLLTAEADTGPAEADIEAVTDATHSTTIDADADTDPAESDLLATTTATRSSIITALALTSAAEFDLDDAAADRTVTFNGVIGDVPTAAELVTRIGTIRVPIDAYIRHMPRIDGNR